MRANSHIWTTVRLCTSEQSPLCSVFCLRLQNNPSSLTALLRCPAPAAVDKLALPLADRCASSQYPALRALGRVVPFPQKVTLGSPARLQTPARRLRRRCRPFAGSSLFQNFSQASFPLYIYIQRYLPVTLFLSAFISSTEPRATIRPPCCPPPGPMSTM